MKYIVLLVLLTGLSLVLVSGVAAQQQAPPEPSKSVSQSSQNPPLTSSNQPGTLTALPGVLLSTETLLGSEVKSPQEQR
jgi:hypothetical protein